MKNQNARKIFCLLASHADVLRASSRVPCKRTFKGEGTPHEALGTSAWLGSLFTKILNKLARCTKVLNSYETL